MAHYGYECHSAHPPGSFVTSELKNSCETVAIMSMTAAHSEKGLDGAGGQVCSPKS